MSYVDNFNYIFNKHSINNSFNFDKEISQKVWKFFKEVIPKLGYEEREGQEDMALDISDAIRDNEHLMIEAGVGIGKSYAYLVPLLYYNNLTKYPIVISTSTIVLQEQLLKDIAKLSKILKLDLKVILTKGMTHLHARKEIRLI